MPLQRLHSYIAPALYILSLAACETPTKKITQAIQTGIGEDGFECRVAVSTFDGPGWVTELTKDRKLFRVRSFESEVTIAKSPLGLAQSKRNVSYSGSLVANLLGAFGKLSGANASAVSSGVSTTEVQLADAYQEITYQIDEDKIVSWARDNLKPKDGSRYFLIREAIGAKTFNLSVTDNDIAAFGGSAKFKQLIDTEAALSYVGNQETNLIATFDQPMRVCVKARELVLVQGLDGGKTWDLQNKDSAIEPTEIYKKSSDVE